MHEVRDLSQTAAFYEGCFGLSALPVDGRTVLAASSGAGLGLELLDSPRAEGYDAGIGFGWAVVPQCQEWPRMVGGAQYGNAEEDR